MPHSTAWRGRWVSKNPIVKRYNRFKDKQWIPTSMTVSYSKIAKTDLHASCTINRENWNEKFDLPLEIEVKNTEGIIVMKAIIKMKISNKKMPRKEL